jgi:hypothetical protein
MFALLAGWRSRGTGERLAAQLMGYLGGPPVPSSSYVRRAFLSFCSFLCRAHRGKNEKVLKR